MPFDVMEARRRVITRRLAGSDNLVNVPSLQGDWLPRQIVPDMYPRALDPGRPAATVPQMVPPGATAQPAPASITDIFANLTTPGSRPIVVQKGVSFTLNPGTTPIPITNQPFYVDTMFFNVPSTALQSVFFGFGSAITTSSGEEIRPGSPQQFEVDNTREQWEIQRPLEVICNLIAYYFNVPGLVSYRAPRVVWNTNDWFLVSTAPTPVAVTLFYTPEMQ